MLDVSSLTVMKICEEWDRAKLKKADTPAKRRDRSSSTVTDELAGPHCMPVAVQFVFITINEERAPGHFLDENFCSTQPGPKAAMQ